MDLTKLYEILTATTLQLRKGEVEEKRRVGPLEIIDIYAMPHVDDPAYATHEKVDLEFVVVAVDAKAAEQHRDSLVEILREYPDHDELKGGPSYITVGARVGSQDAAVQLFALGKVLGLWGVITPTMLGAKGEQARDLATRGYVMITGFG